MWSIGGVLEIEDREKLQSFMQQSDMELDLPVIAEGSGETIFDYYVDQSGI